MRRRRRADDRGETLVELLATIAIMGTAVVAIIGATATAIHLSAVHREQAKAGAYLRAFAEAIETSVARSPTGYVSCAKAGDYSGLYPVPPVVIDPYVATVLDVAIWTSANKFQSTASGCATDFGVQRISLQVSLAVDQVSETLDIVIRRPCRPTDSSDTACA